ncbi:hypothetical protein PMAYCL1PPCAC_27842, partial [Pristionchus mayeri]
VVKERERRAREAAGFNGLRHILEAVDPTAFWRMEKVDIVEGAIALIEQIGAGATEQTLPGREAIEEEHNLAQDEKLSRVEVGKRRRARESRGVKKLKELLMTYAKGANSKMDKLGVLLTAAAFLKEQAVHTSSPRTSSIGSGTSSSTSSPGSGTSASPPGFVPSPTATGPVLSPEQLAYMMQPAIFTAMSSPAIFQVPPFDSGNLFSRESTAKKVDMFRPWE